MSSRIIIHDRLDEETIRKRQEQKRRQEQGNEEVICTCAYCTNERKKGIPDFALPPFSKEVSMTIKREE
jgi:hypothetical protein